MKNRFLILAVLAACFAAPSIYAQEAEFEKGTVERDQAKASQTATASGQAQARQTFDAVQGITYEQILDRPDDVALNLNFARQQIKENDLLGAAATLERVLLLNPGLHDVRLLYGVVLYRLDNLPEARIELEKVSGPEIPDVIRQESQVYIQKINKLRRRYRLSLRESVGFQLDENRNAAPSSKRRLLGNAPINLTGSTTQQRDTAFLNITRVDAGYDLGFQAGHELISSFTYYHSEQTKVDSLDLQSFQYALGTILKNRFFHFTPTFEASHIMLSRQSFLRTQGGNFLFSRDFSRGGLFSLFRYEYQDYLPISENNAARERTGRYLNYAFGGNYRILPTMDLGANLNFGNKNAKHEYNSYERFGIGFDHTWILGKGQFLLNAVDFDLDYYDEPDVAIAGRHRRDRAMRYNVTYGAPLTTLLIGKILPGPFKDIVLTLGYEYYRSLSTITNYTYSNNRFQTMLTKKWEF